MGKEEKSKSKGRADKKKLTSKEEVKKMTSKEETKKMTSKEEAKSEMKSEIKTEANTVGEKKKKCQKEPEKDRRSKEKDEEEKKADDKRENDEGEEKSENSEVPINIDPEEANFPHSGGKSEHIIVNFTNKRMALKVRCGSKYYRVDPTYMIIEPNKCRQLNITRLAGPIGTDKIVVQYYECDKDSTDAKGVFKVADAEGKNIPNIKIKLIASAKGGPKMSRELVDE
ncbi:unnamed protein product [Caenorhabditis bovis]|uniref:Major sperm protein n=1 Tax=Caenorhabditis bovis TaxID=2654633 RepID=A0A8S1ESJ7_9PELO|nr:unnamed protein product [Caenorhabditis bovis]